MALGQSGRLLALLSLATFISVGLSAERAVPAFAAACGSGTAYSGTGTSGDPYVISEADHLIYLSQTTADWSGKHFRQSADIDLQDCTFSPIGTTSSYFTGTYDGEGNAISGLTIEHTDSGEYAGLFGATNGDLTIKNLGLDGVSVSSSGNEAVGALLGYANLGSGAVAIQNVYASGDVSAASGTRAGGLLGELREWSSGTIDLTDSYSSVAVTGPSGAGGLAANTVTGTVAFTNTYSTGVITRAGGAGPQGILGNDASSGGVDFTVNDTYWDTETTGASTGWPRSPDVGTGKTTSEMKLLATFAAWDIVDGWEAYDFDNPTNEWGICSTVNDGYPFLLWEYDANPCPSSGDGGSGSSEATAGPAGIFLAVAGPVGRSVAETPVYFGSYSIKPNTQYSLRLESVTNRGQTRAVLASGAVNARGSLDDRVELTALSPGTYKIVMTGTHRLGHTLALTNYISVGANGTFVSISPEALQPTLN